MSDLNKMRKELILETKLQRKAAWKEKDYYKSIKIREEEQKNYEKLQLLDGIIKAKQKGNKNDR